MVDLLGVGLGAALVVLVVALHATRGAQWQSNPDIADEVRERRTETVPETDFPEPGNRSIGGGGVPAAVGGEAAEGELAGDTEPDDADGGPAAIPDDEAEVFEVEYAKEGETVEVKENETILEAGEDEGWDLPYSCRQGQCVSCCGHVEDGPSEEYVVHDGQEMLDENELDDGYTLTCVAYPKADFTIESGETP